MKKSLRQIFFPTSIAGVFLRYSAFSHFLFVKNINKARLGESGFPKICIEHSVKIRVNAI